MTLELKTDEIVSPTEIELPEFGPLNKDALDQSKSWCGRVYRIGFDKLKSLTEALGFTARFEMPNMKAAHCDVFNDEGLIVCEIDRNTRPVEISVRYSRERWFVQDLVGKADDKLRAHIKTEYRCKGSLADVVKVLAEQAGLEADVLARFYIRIDFKKRSIGLIAADQDAALLPEGEMASFEISKALEDDRQSTKEALATTSEPVDELPLTDEEIVEDSVPDVAEAPPQAPEAPVAVPVIEANKVEHSVKLVEEPRKRMSETPATYSTKNSSTSFEGQAKYATYSRSEIDHMFKQQAESILNALSGKVASQQRAFQEAISSQEKAFTRLSDNFNAQFEAARAKLESTTRAVETNTKAELDEFHKQLSKELENYRTQVNKSILPVAKALEDKSIKQPPKESKNSSTNAALQSALAANRKLQQLMIATLLVSLVSLAISFVTLSTVGNSKASSATTSSESTSN